MNLQNALDVLEINEKEYTCITENTLKRKYHKLALEYHPDKNGNTIQSTEKFQLITEAYEYIKREISISNIEIDTNFEEEKNETNNDYTKYIYLFINEIIVGAYCSEFSEIVKDIIVGCKKISLKLFEKIDKNVSLEIYAFLSKYQKIFHISIETLEEVKKIILEKCKGDQLFILNPSLSDLFNNNIFKLCIEDKIYFVPLWHSECYFDGNNGDIIVKCIPQLPDNVEIDEENNIIVSVKLPFSYSLLNEKLIDIFLENNVSFSIPVNKLRLEKYQSYILKKKGISKIMDDIHDINNKSDIFINISFLQP
jgi:hypothetical protein